MRARLHDADGPLWVRLILPALGLSCVVAGLYWRIVDGPSVGATFFMGFAMALLAPLLVGRHRPRDVELHASAGRVEVRNAGILRQTLRAKDVVGAFTSRPLGSNDRGGSLAMSVRGRAAAPIVLDLASEADAAAVRAAL